MLETFDLKRWLLPFVSRPYLMTAIAVGGVLAFATTPWIERGMTRALIGWNGGILVFLGFSFHYMLGANSHCMRRRAINHNEGRHVMLVIAVLAAIASVTALAVELSVAKGQPGVEQRVALAAGTMVLSWLFVQITYAMHYAHVYYLAENGS
jgi:uncharacterized membrane protein